MDDAEKRQQYEARLQVLKEQKKMHLLTQDSYDRAATALAREIYGEEKPKEN